MYKTDLVMSYTQLIPLETFKNNFNKLFIKILGKKEPEKPMTQHILIEK